MKEPDKSGLCQASLDAFAYLERLHFLVDTKALKRSSAIAQLDKYWSKSEIEQSEDLPMLALLMTLSSLQSETGSGAPKPRQQDYNLYFDALEKIRQLVSMHSELGLSAEHLSIDRERFPFQALHLVGLRSIDNDQDFVSLESNEQYQNRSLLIERAIMGRELEEEDNLINTRGPRSRDTYAVRKLWRGIRLSERQLLDKCWFSAPYAMLAELLHCVGYAMDVKIVEQTMKREMNSP